MRTLPACFRGFNLLYGLFSAMFFLMGAGALHANTAPREAGNSQDGPPPQLSSGSQIGPAIFEKPIPSDQLTFLNKFSGSDSGDVIHDKQYRKLLKSLVPDCIFHYGHDMSLYDALTKKPKDSPCPFNRDGVYDDLREMGRSEGRVHVD